MFVLGCAYQKGRLPVHHDAVHKAIELNGQAIQMNKRAFALGRLYAIEPDRVQALAYPGARPLQRPPGTLDEVTAHRAGRLRQYQNQAYADRYREAVEGIRRAERDRARGFSGLALTAARNLHSVMAYKDEYEVARLFASRDFRHQIAETFEGNYRIEFNLAPPFLARPDHRTGRPRKIRLGRWMLGVFRVLSRMRGLRGTAFDIFGYSRERRVERQMVDDYFADIDLVVRCLDPDNHKLALDLLRWPESVRGYGDIKRTALEQARGWREELRSALQNPSRDSSAA